jgi:uncharacterized protein YdcH (DUF465 family)
MTGSPEARERLSREDAHFRRLVEKHQEYDDRLATLRAQRWLSEVDKLEEVKLKKLKLAVKDEIEAILRRHTG